MKVLKTILRSFILGIGVGVLVAPRAGAETRRMLSEKLNSVLEGANDLTGNLGQASSGGNTDYQANQPYTGSNATREVGNSDAISM